MSLQSSAGKVFNYLANLTAAAGLLSYWGICFTYIRFSKGLRAQGIDRKTSPYWSYFNAKQVAAWYAIVLITILLFFSSYTVFFKGEWAKDGPANFVTNYLPVFLFPVLWIGWKFFKETHFVRPHEMDFVTDLDLIEADMYDEPPARNVFEKVGQAIF